MALTKFSKRAVTRLSDVYKPTTVADVKQRVDQVLDKVKELGFGIDANTALLQRKGTLWFKVPLVHAATGNTIEANLTIDLASGEVTLDQSRHYWSKEPRAVRISLKKKLTVTNNVLRWMFLKKANTVSKA